MNIITIFKKPVFLIAGFFFISNLLLAHNTTDCDSIKGANSLYRKAYDVTFYNIKMYVDIDNQSVSGVNTISGNFTSFPSSILQLDADTTLIIDSIIRCDFVNQNLYFYRVCTGFFILMHHDSGTENFKIKVYYHGKPKVAKKAPWDGGMIWQYDANKKPWIAVTCEGDGAQTWWPCKNWLADEPDSMRISIGISNKYADENISVISNGKAGNQTIEDNITYFNWQVSYSINPYNFTLYIGNYKMVTRTFESKFGSYPMTFCVLKQNLKKIDYLEKNTTQVLHCFESYYGKYPFWMDGYKLVDAPYLGMEHQSAIAYGNKYESGYNGYNPLNLKFDYIIMHETAHEWWGNWVSCADLGDMWIHESFTTYSEALYFEKILNKSTAMAWMKKHKKSIENKRPIAGPYQLYYDGSKYDIDMYYKGAWALQCLRYITNNDNLFFNMLKGLQDSLGQTTTNAAAVFNLMNRFLNKNHQPFFNQYFKYAALPQLQIIKNDLKFTLKLIVEEPNFEIPIRFNNYIFTLKNNEPYNIELNKTEYEELINVLENYYLLDVYIP
jgi:aminopeptidase N